MLSLAGGTNFAGESKSLATFFESQQRNLSDAEIQEPYSQWGADVASRYQEVQLNGGFEYQQFSVMSSAVNSEGYQTPFDSIPDNILLASHMSGSNSGDLHTAELENFTETVIRSASSMNMDFNSIGKTPSWQHIADQNAESKKSESDVKHQSAMTP